MCLINVAATHVSKIARGCLHSTGGSLHAVSAPTAIVPHIKTCFGTQSTIPRIIEHPRGVLGIVAHVIPAVQVSVFRAVASVKCSGVQRLNGDDARPAILEATHVTRFAMTASAWQTLVAVGACTTILVAGGVILVRGTFALQPRLATQIRVNVDAIGANTKTLTAKSTDEARVSLVALLATLIGERVDGVKQRRCALMQPLLVSTVIIHATSERRIAFLNSRHFCLGWVVSVVHRFFLWHRFLKTPR